ncbi:MAG: fibronectin type III domain-containing protein [ANME-2 cluster archaeon]|nr:fibronectin type III domain-containing protein [ANME-2 cluster archaeon]
MLKKRNSMSAVFVILLISLNICIVSATPDCMDCHVENATIQQGVENPHILTEPVQTSPSLITEGFNIGILSVNSPPSVNDISSKAKATTAFISWDSNESTDNRVYYGTDQTDITSWVNGTWSHWKNNTLEPFITLTDLSTNTPYYYRIESTNDYGKTNNTTPVQSFTTAHLNMDISTNRYVILEDPKYSGSNAGPGFEIPPDPALQQNWTGSDWNSDYWDGESTSIRAYVLVMNEQGMGAGSAQVNFTLKNPVGTTIDINSSTTDSSGVASYLFDLNDQNYWGTWTIEANSTVNGKYVNSSTDFTLNWWGCALCHGDPGSALFNQTLSINGSDTNPNFPTPN